MQQFGSALGVAVLGTLFFQWLPGDGWSDATRAVIVWVSIACYAAAFVTVLLPSRRTPARRLSRARTNHTQHGAADRATGGAVASSR